MSPLAPRISVVVPTYNRPEQLVGCLRALNAQDVNPADFEVIVVDDGSRFSLEEVVQRERTAAAIRLLRQENSGQATARNLGAREAYGEYLAFTDDDCRPAPNWLSALLARLQLNPGALIGGLIVNALSSNVYSATSQMLVDYLYESYTSPTGLPLFFTSNNFAVARSIFLELGGFEPVCRVSSEDREFCHRWHQSGLPSLFAPEGIVYHAHELSLTSFWRQHFTYGRGAFHFRTVLVATGQRPVKLEGLAFYKNLVLYPWRSSKDSRRCRCTSLMVLTQFANVFGFGFEALVSAGKGTQITSRRHNAKDHALASGATDGVVPTARFGCDKSSHMATSERAAAPIT
jgi:GT2 family glycosyltransferase